MAQVGCAERSQRVEQGAGDKGALAGVVDFLRQVFASVNKSLIFMWNFVAWLNNATYHVVSLGR